MKNIGILIHQAEQGKEVWYYNFYSKENQNNCEPIKTKITSNQVYEIGGQPTCFVEHVSGVVALSHLSFHYYKEEYHKQPTRSQLRYKEYLESDGLFSSFKDFLRYPCLGEATTGRRKGLYK